MEGTIQKIAAILLIFATSCGDQHPPEVDVREKEQTPRTDTNRIAGPLRNDSLTYVANYIAGIFPDDSTALNGIFLKKDWKQYRSGIEENWQSVRNERLNKLSEWQSNELAPRINDTLPLFYPFSGPDFLHANSFFPDATNYYFIAIEPVIEINLRDDRFLHSMEHGLRDVLGKSYFITTHMREDLGEDRAGGVIPILYAFLGRTGHEIINVYPIEVDSTGRIYRHDSLNYERNQAVCFEFRKQGDKRIKTLNYFNRSISDRDLDTKFPGFKRFLEHGLPECNTFVKAASYLMHYGGFSYVRDAVLTHSDVIFQDDTGVPLRYIDRNTWSIQLYGAYTRPIKDFSDAMYQADLKELYANTPDSLIHTIPFSLGYHVVGDRIQNHQLITRQ